MAENSLQKWPGLRIIVTEKQEILTEIQSTNLFWIKEGYLYFGVGMVRGEVACRALMLLQQWMPFKEVDLEKLNWSSQIIGSAESFYVDPQRRLAKYLFLRRSVKSFMVWLIEQWLGINWRRKFPEIWPILSLRQIGDVQIGNSREVAKKLRKEFE